MKIYVKNESVDHSLVIKDHRERMTGTSGYEIQVRNKLNRVVKTILVHTRVDGGITPTVEIFDS